MFEFFSLTDFYRWASRLRTDSDLVQGLLSFFIVAFAFLLNRFIARLIRRRFENPRDPELLIALIGTRNAIVGIAAFTFIFIWLGEIRHALFSLAAIAAAFLLISKEFWMNFFGMLLRTVGQPFNIGDVIEINGHTGRVVDMDSLTFKLLAYGPMGLMTSRVVEMPNAILLTHPVVNHSMSGAFGFQFMRVCLKSTDPISQAKILLEEAALQVCQPYTKEAQAWFERKGNQMHVDFPDASVRVLIESKDHDQVDLVVRFPSPVSQKVQVQQEIIRAFYDAWPPRNSGN
jgi:small-conductance mechanosensitive channel